MSHVMRFLPHVKTYQFDTVLDVGCGEGAVGRALTADGRTVTSIDLRAMEFPWRHIQGNFMEHDFGSGPYDVGETFDAVFASYIIEHIQDTATFLAKVRALLKPGGMFFCFTAPMKPEVVGGHVNLYNVGLLAYNLILGGFDCKHGRFCTRDYNIAAFVGRDGEPLPELVYDRGDIEALVDHFPMPTHHGFNGDIENVNWFDGDEELSV